LFQLSDIEPYKIWVRFPYGLQYSDFNALQINDLQGLFFNLAEFQQKSLILTAKCGLTEYFCQIINEQSNLGTY
jgi:hypothetical protein